MMLLCLKWRISVVLGHGANIVIGILVFPDFQLLDAAGPISVFEIAARFAGTTSSIKILAVAPGAVRSSSGVEIFANPIRHSRAIRTLIVVGAEKMPPSAMCKTTLSFVRTMAKRGGRVASV